MIKITQVLVIGCLCKCSVGRDVARPVNSISLAQGQGDSFPGFNQGDSIAVDQYSVGKVVRREVNAIAPAQEAGDQQRVAVDANGGLEIMTTQKSSPRLEEVGDLEVMSLDEGGDVSVSEAPYTAYEDDGKTEIPLLTNGHYEKKHDTNFNRVNKKTGQSIRFDLRSIQKITEVKIANGNAHWGGTESTKQWTIFKSACLKGPWKEVGKVTFGQNANAQTQKVPSPFCSRFIKMRCDTNHGNGDQAVLRQMGFSQAGSCSAEGCPADKGAPGPKGSKGQAGPPGPKGGDGSAGKGGSNGASGRTGATGKTGARGPKGDPGANGQGGKNGASGQKGASGQTGPPGSKGNNGVAGQAGKNGAAGPKGENGKTGARGPRGNNGVAGKAGENGAPGQKGSTGQTGARGLPGQNGVAGQAGKNGVPGADGAPGRRGARGRKGEKGDTGNTGEKGASGLKGATGKTGARGLKGENGSAGKAGQTGAPGPHGATGKIGADGLKGEVGAPGKAGKAGASGPKGVAGQAGARGLKGEKGDVGAAGENGTRGVKGAPGQTGARGLKGEKGDAGEAGQNGTKGAPGAKGPKGDPGVAAKGVPGPPGPPGPVNENVDNADGKTVTEIIAGKPGPTGPKGDQGNPGKAPPKIDCVWETWLEWEPCSQGCADKEGSSRRYRKKGERRRERSVKIYPQDGGKTCPGKGIEIEACGTTACHHAAIVRGHHVGVTRPVLIQSVFHIFDVNQDWDLNSYEMRQFATRLGFDGSDALWNAEYAWLQQRTHVHGGIGMAGFTDLLNDRSQRGLFCSDEELGQIDDLHGGWYTRGR